MNILDYNMPDALPCSVEKTLWLAAVETRLKSLDAVTQECLINWGYASCDVAMRRWADSTLDKPVGFPYPQSGVGD